MPTAWEEPPGSERLIEGNVQRVLTEIASVAGERRPPTVAQAQQWHRELYDFERGAHRACALLDAEIAPATDPWMLTPSQLHGVLTLCAVLHGEWIRIHPFANGNGRTARLWANWAALRFELPPFVTIKPRPGQPYAAAAMASMRADHQMMTAVFDQMLRTSLQSLD
jgi:hypothetical protein